MPLYLLEREGEINYDEYAAKIIWAKSVSEARNIANLAAGDEGRIWDNLIKVKCTHLSVPGESKEILASFNAGGSICRM